MAYSNADSAIQPDRELAPLWRSTNGKLLVQTCRSCDHTFYYARYHCPACFSEDVAWVECAGTGRIYSFSIVRRGVPAPYALAMVTLDEGPRMMTNIIDTDLDTIRIDQKVTVAFQDLDGILTPMFRLA